MPGINRRAFLRQTLHLATGALLAGCNKLQSVGSTNMDNRSFRLNDECNLNITDEHLANSMSSVFEADKSFSREITLKMWQQRPLTDKAFEWTASLFRSQV